MQEHETEHAHGDRDAGSVGMFADVASLFALVGASVRDTTRLLSLETRLVFRTIFTMVMLSLMLGFVTAGIWIFVSLAIVASLYEYTGMGMTLSICVVTLANMAGAAALFIMLKHLAHRLTFPQTRRAVRTVINEASHIINKEEEQP